MSDVRYIQNLKVGGMTEENDELVSFEGIASTDSLNTYFYRMHISSLRNFRDDAIDGRPVYSLHRVRENLNLGNTFGANLYGKKVKMQWNILRGLEDINSDDIIKRLVNGVTRELTVGHDFAEYMCNECGGRMHTDLFVPMCSKGHCPGMAIRKNGEDHTVTATAHNARLKELSIVGRGADPDTKIIGMLKQELASDNMNAQGLAFLSEFYNLNYNSFFNQLGYNGYPPKQYSIPTRKKSMAANPDLLAKTNEELQTKNEELQTRVDELEADIQKLPTEEEYANLQKDISALQSELDSADLAELKQLAAQGQAYLDIVRDEAKNETDVRWCQESGC